MKDDNNNSVQSIDRVLDIWKRRCPPHPSGLALSELAAATSHASTAHRLLASLVGRGYARKDPESGKYRLTLRLYEISRRVSSVLDLFTASKPILEVLSNEVKEVIHLVERDGNEVVYLYKFEPFFRPINITSSSVGLTTPCTAPAWEKASWPTCPRRRCAPFGSRPRSSASPPKTIATWEDLQADLALIRQRGYAIDDEEHDLGVRCVAAPIFNWNGMPVGAMSISGLSVG